MSVQVLLELGGRGLSPSALFCLLRLHLSGAVITAGLNRLRIHPDGQLHGIPLGRVGTAMTRQVESAVRSIHFAAHARAVGYRTSARHQIAEGRV